MYASVGGLVNFQAYFVEIVRKQALNLTVPYHSHGEYDGKCGGTKPSDHRAEP